MVTGLNFDPSLRMEAETLRSRSEVGGPLWSEVSAGVIFLSPPLLHLH